MRRALITLWACLATVASVPACDGGQEIICVGRVEVGADGKTRCFGTPPAQADVVVTPQPDVVVTPQPDVVVTPQPDAVADVEVSVDTGPDPEQQCPAALAGKKSLMAACSKHCECKTGYCYDEGAYLGGFRFCTRACGQEGCTSEGEVAGLQTTVCLILGGQLAVEHPEIVTTNLCAAVCKNLDDCKALGSAYDTCGSPSASCGFPSDTCWGNVTLAAQKTCQISSTVQ
ncbi:MAG: hypothetical protein R3F39_22800 [Myxococcota bacterium]